MSDGNAQVRETGAASAPFQMVNDERTVLVTFWSTGATTVALRDERGATWGPPVTVRAERANG